MIKIHILIIAIISIAAVYFFYSYMSTNSIKSKASDYAGDGGGRDEQWECEKKCPTKGCRYAGKGNYVCRH